MYITKHFHIDEIKCRCGCELADIDPEFMSRVQLLRDIYKKPMRVNSAVRCVEHNRKVGGARGSYHISDKASGRVCRAVDIHIEDSVMRHKFIRIALGLFHGVGIYHNFVHVDGRERDKMSCWVG